MYQDHVINLVTRKPFDQNSGSISNLEPYTLNPNPYTPNPTFGDTPLDKVQGLVSRLWGLGFRVFGDTPFHQV